MFYYNAKSEKKQEYRINYTMAMKTNEIEALHQSILYFHVE